MIDHMTILCVYAFVGACLLLISASAWRRK